MLNTSNKIRVAIHDDQYIFRKGLVSIVNSCDDFELIGDFSDTVQFLETATSKMPDIVFLSVTMIQKDFHNLLKAFAENHSQVGFIGVSDYKDILEMGDPLNAGVKGLMIRGASGEDVLTAVKSVYDCGMYYSTELKTRIVNTVRSDIQSLQARMDNYLTKEDRIIVRMLCRGMTVKEIATEFTVTLAALEKRKNRLYRKLNITNIIQLMNYAILHGLYNPFERQ